MDACIKLDTYLGDFIEFLDDHVGLENVLFALTADHGGLPLPEYLIDQGQRAGRINNDHFGDYDHLRSNSDSSSYISEKIYKLFERF